MPKKAKVRSSSGGVEAPPRRTGDTVAIAGSYQFNAATTGNSVQRFWHANKTRTIDRYLPPRRGDTVLDVGCGSGVVASFLAKSGARVRGYDGSEEAIAFAKTTFERPGLSFHRGLVDQHFELEQPVDKIYCLEVLEHIHHDQGQQMLRHFHRCLKPGGAVYLTTPNYRSPWPLIEWTLDRCHLVPRLDGEQHVAKYHRSTLGQLSVSVGFTVERIASTCLVAPWLAPISWRLAQRVEAVETGNVLPGCILVAVLRKPMAANA